MGGECRIRRLIRFSGRVQGVGFRYTTCQLARRYDVAGHVMNLPDGRVECVVEAEPDEMDRFLASLRSEFAGHISREEMQDLPSSGQSGEFVVRY